MEANSTHISLETAKLLKDCKVESEWVFMNTIEGDPDDGWKISKSINGVGEYPAYTWQEILWEYPQEFFGEDVYDTFGEYCHTCNFHTCRFTVDILDFLQDKEYDKADKYFRDNCIYIK